MTPEVVRVAPPYEASARVYVWISQLMLHPQRSGLSLLEAALVDAETASLMGRDSFCFLRLLCELLINKVQLSLSKATGGCLKVSGAEGATVLLQVTGIDLYRAVSVGA